MLRNVDTPNKLNTKNAKVSWVTGRNLQKYIRFYKHYNITLAFVDETVIDGPGDDIGKGIEGDGSAHLSVVMVMKLVKMLITHLLIFLVMKNMWDL